MEIFYVDLKIDAEGIKYPTIYNNLLQQTGYFFIQNVEFAPMY